MRDSRNKFYQFTAAYLVSKNIKFTFTGTYISSADFDLTNDASDRKKVWIDQYGDWTSFTDLDSLKSWLKKNI